MKTLPFFYEEIGFALVEAQQQKYATVNCELIMAYWKIGQRMVEKEQRGSSTAGYGHYVIKEFSEQLSNRFGKGFSIANVKNFRQFYLAFPGKKTEPFMPSRNLGWTHYRLIMQVKDPEERQRLIGKAAKQNWSTRQLKQEIAELDSNALTRKNNSFKKKIGPPAWPFSDVNSFTQWLTEGPASHA